MANALRVRLSPTRIQWCGCPDSPGLCPQAPPPPPRIVGASCRPETALHHVPQRPTPPAPAGLGAAGTGVSPAKAMKRLGGLGRWKLPSSQKAGEASLQSQLLGAGRLREFLMSCCCHPTRPAFLLFIEGMSWGEALRGRLAELLPAQRRCALWTPVMSPPPQGHPRRRQCSPVLPDVWCGQLGDSPSGHLFHPEETNSRGHGRSRCSEGCQLPPEKGGNGGGGVVLGFAESCPPGGLLRGLRLEPQVRVREHPLCVAASSAIPGPFSGGRSGPAPAVLNTVFITRGHTHAFRCSERLLLYKGQS